MSFEKLNELFPEGAPDASDFFSHDPIHGFTVSIVLGLTGESHYVKAYQKFVNEHWKPGATPIKQEPKQATAPTQPTISIKK